MKRNRVLYWSAAARRRYVECGITMPRFSFGVRRRDAVSIRGDTSPHSKYGVRHHDATLAMDCGVMTPHSESVDMSAHSKHWPHAPAHWLFEPGIYMVTAGTYGKLAHWNTPEKLNYLRDSLFSRAAEFGWSLQAWAVLSNHYHFIADSPADPATLRRFIGKLHMTTAKQLNEWDETVGRKVWFQYWDSRITYERSYLARLNYVHHNPAQHGVVERAEDYPWCSASWFARSASPAFVSTVKNFKTDKLKIKDDF